MIFNVTFKTPDTVDYAIKTEVGYISLPESEDPALLEDLKDERKIQMQRLVERFVQYGEQITIKFDTETGTATVVPV